MSTVKTASCSFVGKSGELLNRFDYRNINHNSIQHWFKLFKHLKFLRLPSDDTSCPRKIMIIADSNLNVCVTKFSEDTYLSEYLWFR